jgi:hypothetical protein
MAARNVIHIHNMTRQDQPVAINQFGRGTTIVTVPNTGWFEIPDATWVTPQLQALCDAGVLFMAPYTYPDQRVFVLGYLINRLSVYTGGNGYRVTEDAYSIPVSVPADYGSSRVARVTVSLAAEQQPYTGGTPIVGTIYQDGSPTSAVWDSYWMKLRQGATLLHTYYLNYNSTNVSRSGIIVTTLDITLSPGQSLEFSFTSSDNITTNSSADNSTTGITFNQVQASTNPSWESGAWVSVEFLD